MYDGHMVSASRLQKVIPALLLLAALSLSATEQTYAELVKATDPSNAEQVFALALWCQEHNQPSRARQHLSQVVTLNKNHTGALTLLGQVRDGGRRVPQSQLTDGVAKEAAGNGKTLVDVTAPAASEVRWNLSIPADPTPDDQFLTDYIARMSRVSNESREMEVSISTLLNEENLASGLSKLCAALASPGFTDLYGPSEIVRGLLKDGRRAQAQRLFGFIALASTRVSDADDLGAFCFAAEGLRDLRALPRLIELMRDDKSEVASAAGAAARAITGLPRAGMTVEKASAWWKRFHGMEEAQILAVQAKSKDPDTAIPAATHLALLGDPSAIDVFIAFMRVDDPKISGKAHGQLTQLLGNDWGFDPTHSTEDRQKRLELLSKWWKENKDSFRLIVDPRAQMDPSRIGDADGKVEDRLNLAVQRIGSANAKAALNAESDLISGGNAAVPHLIHGLTSSDPIIARKCQELLQRISDKSDIAYDPRDSAESKRKAVAAWTEWANRQKLMPTGDAAEAAADE